MRHRCCIPFGSLMRPPTLGFRVASQMQSLHNPCPAWLPLSHRCNPWSTTTYVNKEYRSWIKPTHHVEICLWRTMRIKTEITRRASDASLCKAVTRVSGRRRNNVTQNSDDIHSCCPKPRYSKDVCPIDLWWHPLAHLPSSFTLKYVCINIYSELKVENHISG